MTTPPLNGIETKSASWTPRDWTNDSGQQINADALNHINDGIQEALDKLDAITPKLEAINFDGGGKGDIIRQGQLRTLIIKDLKRTFTSSWQVFNIYKLPESDRPQSFTNSCAIMNDNADTGHVILSINGDKTDAEFGCVQLKNMGGVFPTGNNYFYGSISWYV